MMKTLSLKQNWRTRSSILVLLLSILYVPVTWGQSPEGNKAKPITVSRLKDYTSDHKLQKGTFFITPFYQYTSFRHLKLISHSNNFYMWEGNLIYDYTDQEIASYNNNFGTEYTNSLNGVRIGYQITDYLGISLMVGANHYNLKSWVSDNGHESVTTQLPSLTYGITTDYVFNFSGKMVGMALASFNRCQTSKPVTEIISGSDVLNSRAASSSLELNLAAGYRFRNFIPYAGAGFSQQFIHTERTEIIPDVNDQGDIVEDSYIFESKFRGSSAYCFTGAEYSITRNLSFYLRAAFLNPARLTCGIRIIL